MREFYYRLNVTIKYANKIYLDTTNKQTIDLAEQVWELDLMTTSESGKVIVEIA